MAKGGNEEVGIRRGSLSRLRTFLIMMSTVVLMWAGSPLSSEAIVIDGNPGDWGAIIPLVSDPDEGTIPDDYDLEDFYVTNDNTDMFFRLDVYGTPTLAGLFPLNPAFYQVYLDIDQDTNTGILVNGIGADRVVDYRSSGVSVYDGTWTTVGTGAQSSTTEIRAPLTSLGLSPGMAVNMFAYLDNGDLPPDDRTSVGGYQVIPEPATLLLLGTGLLAFRKKSLYRRLKRSSSAGLIG